MKASFGSQSSTASNNESNSNSPAGSDRELDQRENDQLVLAGNGEKGEETGGEQTIPTNYNTDQSKANPTTSNNPMETTNFTWWWSFIITTIVCLLLLLAP